MAVDHLSRMLDLVSVHGVVSGGARVSGPWRAQTSVAEPLKFCAMVRGAAWLMTDGIDQPIRLTQGDVVLLNGRSWLSLQGGADDDPPTAATETDDGPRTEIAQPSNGEIVDLGGKDGERTDIFIGGRIDLDAAGHELLLNALPAVAHVHSSADSAARVRDHVQRLFEEITTELPGGRFAVREYSQLLILDVVRTVADRTQVPDGWLKLLGDEQLRPALDLMHGQPEAGWSLDDLAHAAAMSRTMFAVRFRAVAGIPPLSYLAQWRMLLAKCELRLPGTRIRPLALKLGYSSESSFSSAFKRNVGESPHSYRSRVLCDARTGAPSPDEELPSTAQLGGV